MFTAFLGTLNGSAMTGCFAGHCDWRLPTIGELRSMLDAQYPNCTMSPCTSIPGFTVSAFYWSSSTYSGFPERAWGLYFDAGTVSDAGKSAGGHVRAVRGGS